MKEERNESNKPNLIKQFEELTELEREYFLNDLIATIEIRKFLERKKKQKSEK